MENKQIIAIVDDEPEIARLIGLALEEHGFVAEHHATGQSLLDKGVKGRIDLVLLDLGLPDRDGLAILASIRQSATTPVIILSGRSQSTERIVGLELGADDYVVKPFDPREIVARVRSVLRRSQPPAEAGRSTHIARFAGWVYDRDAQTLSAPEDRMVPLSVGEASLLEAFLDAPLRVLDRDHLLMRAGAEDSFDRAIDVRISRLRKKLGDAGDGEKLIRTVYGAGYLFATRVSWDG